MKIQSMRLQPGDSAPSRGFTLVELLVVILVIILLAAVVVGAARSAQTSAAKVADMNNLRNLAAAAMASGGDNAGRLPTLHPTSQSAPYWLLSREYLESNGIFKESCYAPSRNIYGGAPTYLWWYGYGTSTPVHYVYFANDGSTRTNGWYMLGNVTPPSRSEYRGGIPYDEITKDQTKAFPRSFTDDAWYPILWAGLCRDYPGTPRVAAIMRNGEVLGVNVMYLDSHMEWIPKNKIKQRYSAGSLKVLW